MSTAMATKWHRPADCSTREPRPPETRGLRLLTGASQARRVYSLMLSEDRFLQIISSYINVYRCERLVFISSLRHQLCLSWGKCLVLYFCGMPLGGRLVFTPRLSVCLLSVPCLCHLLNMPIHHYADVSFNLRLHLPACSNRLAVYVVREGQYYLCHHQSGRHNCFTFVPSV